MSHVQLRQVLPALRDDGLALALDAVRPAALRCPLVLPPLDLGILLGDGPSQLLDLGTAVTHNMHLSFQGPKFFIAGGVHSMGTNHSK